MPSRIEFPRRDFLRIVVAAGSAALLTAGERRYQQTERIVKIAARGFQTLRERTGTGRIVETKAVEAGSLFLLYLPLTARSETAQWDIDGSSALLYSIENDDRGARTIACQDPETMRELVKSSGIVWEPGGFVGLGTERSCNLNAWFFTQRTTFPPASEIMFQLADSDPVNLSENIQAFQAAQAGQPFEKTAPPFDYEASIMPTEQEALLAVADGGLRVFDLAAIQRGGAEKYSGVLIAGPKSPAQSNLAEQGEIIHTQGQLVWVEDPKTKEIKIIQPAAELTFLTVDTFDDSPLVSAIALEPGLYGPSWLMVDLSTGRYYKVPLEKGFRVHNALTEITGPTDSAIPSRAYAVVRKGSNHSLLVIYLNQPLGAGSAVEGQGVMDPSDVGEFDPDRSFTLAAASRTKEGCSLLVAVVNPRTGQVLGVDQVAGFGDLRSPVPFRLPPVGFSNSRNQRENLPSIPWSERPLDGFNRDWQRQIGH